ncbi:envelope-like protein, partial [Trifolium pratense]
EPKAELEVANDVVSAEITAGTKVDYDYGSFIFDQTIKHIRSTTVKMPIAFPSLLCGIILEQYPDIKVVTNTPKKRESGFTFHHKLFGDHNVADNVGTSTAGAGTMTKKEIIAGLKVQCQEIDKQQAELEERKKMFLKMIEGLEADEVPVKASANVAAAGEQPNVDEDEGYDTATDEDDDSDSSDDE